MELREWKYCVIGNIRKENTDESGRVRRGCKYYPAGRKIYLSVRYQKDERTITVMGLNRYRSHYILECIQTDMIENIRCSRVFKPKVVMLMNCRDSSDLWWGDTDEDYYDTKEYAEMLKSEKEYGTGYESYLRRKLKHELDNEAVQNMMRLEQYGYYRDDYLPLDILYKHPDGYPKEIVKEVLEENPDYLLHWPLLKEYLG